MQTGRPSRCSHSHRIQEQPRQAEAASILWTHAAITISTEPPSRYRTPLASNQALEWFTHYNYAGFWTIHWPSRSSITSTNDGRTSVRYLIDAPLFDHGNRFTMGLQYAGTRQIDYNFENNSGQRGTRKSKNQINNATNVGVYFLNQFDVAPTCSASWAAAVWTTRIVRWMTAF